MNFLLKVVGTSVALFILMSSTIIAQNTSEMYYEFMEDAYVPIDKSLQPRQKPYMYRGGDFFTVQVNVDSNGQDIIGDAANEPSLAVDPTNNDRIVVGWRQFDDISSNFRQAGYGFSLDGGQSFTFPGVIEPGVFRSDPVLDFDTQGNFYYNSLQDDFSCDVFNITDGGTIWSGPAQAKGGDKQWMRIDRSGGVGDGHNYSYWNDAFSTCAPGNFTRSTDGGINFEDCIVVDGDPFWGTLTVDNNGTLYITGTSNANDIIVIKSTNAKEAGQIPTWDFVTDVDLNGDLDIFIPLNPQGLMGQAWVDVDVSNGPGADNIYIVASVANSDDPADVMFARSTDGGVSFEPPIKINTDGFGSYNWFGTMSVAPNGRIDVTWLDTRNDPNNQESQLYFTFSEDQGETWSEERILSPLFDSTVGWPQQNKMGDYFDMKSDNDFAHIAWCNTINGGQDVYYTRVDVNALLSTQEFSSKNVDVQIFPNPASDLFQIHLKGLQPGNLAVDLVDINGRVVAKLYDDYTNDTFSMSFDRTQATFKNLKAGLYFVRINTNNYVTTSKIILK